MPGRPLAVGLLCHSNAARLLEDHCQRLRFGVRRAVLAIHTLPSTASGATLWNVKFKRHTRREFLKNTGRIAAASALAGTAIPHVHAAENNTIQVALIGCGDRGTGAAVDALTARTLRSSWWRWPMFSSNACKAAIEALVKQCGDKVDVPDDRKFIGFDAYRKAMDCLKPGDVVILATPPAFRWVHFTYAIEKGLNVFMEKPVTVDGPTSRRMLALGEEVDPEEPQGRRRPDVPPLQGAAGALRPDQGRPDRRHHRRCGPIARRDRLARPLCRPSPRTSASCSTRSGSSTASCGPAAAATATSCIHNIDECCWMKDAWPVQAEATGGTHLPRRLHRPELRHLLGRIHVRRRRQAVPRRPQHRRLPLRVRQLRPRHQGRGRRSRPTSHTPAKCRIYKGQKMVKKNLTWAFPQPEPNPYQLEWDDLIEAIRKDQARTTK